MINLCWNESVCVTVASFVEKIDHAALAIVHSIVPVPTLIVIPSLLNIDNMHIILLFEWNW